MMKIRGGGGGGAGRCSAARGGRPQPLRAAFPLQRFAKHRLGGKGRPLGREVGKAAHYLASALLAPSSALSVGSNSTTDLRVERSTHLVQAQDLEMLLPESLSPFENLAPVVLSTTSVHPGTTCTVFSSLGGAPRLPPGLVE